MNVKQIMQRLMVGCLLACLPTLLGAQEILSLGTYEGADGDTITLELSMTNQDTIRGFQVDIGLDSLLEYVDGSAQLSSRAQASHSLSVALQSNQSLRVLCFSMSNDHFSGDTGVVLTLRAVVHSGEGTFALPLIDGHLSDQNAQETLDSVATGTLFNPDQGPVSLRMPQVRFSPDLMYEVRNVQGALIQRVSGQELSSLKFSGPGRMIRPVAGRLSACD